MKLLLLRINIKTEIGKDLRNYECKIMEHILADNGSTKKAFKEINNIKSLISSMCNKHGELVHCRGKIVNVATNFYKELYKKREDIGGEEGQGKVMVEGQGDEDFPAIFQAEVRKLLKSIKIDKAVGPDVIDNGFLKLFADKLTPILTKLFNEILTDEVTPIQ